MNGELYVVNPEPPDCGICISNPRTGIPWYSSYQNFVKSSSKLDWLYHSIHSFGMVIAKSKAAPSGAQCLLTNSTNSSGLVGSNFTGRLCKTIFSGSFLGDSVIMIRIRSFCSGDNVVTHSSSPSRRLHKAARMHFEPGSAMLSSYHSTASSNMAENMLLLRGIGF